MAENTEGDQICQTLVNEDVERSEQFQKWNGGEWEKVGSAPSPQLEQAEVNNTDADEEDVSVPLKVMEFIGFPKGYTQSLYSDFINDVNEISSIPSETASSFYSIVNWICGKSDQTSPVDASANSQEGQGELDLPSAKSSNEALTKSTSQILTPFVLSLPKEDNEADESRNICKRLPSLMTVAFIPPHPTETAVYSCEVFHAPDTEKESSVDVDPPKESAILEKKVTFAAPTSESNIYGLQEESQEAQENEEEKTPSVKPKPTHEEDINSNEKEDFIPLPIDRIASKANFGGVKVKPLSPKLLQTIESNQELEKEENAVLDPLPASQPQQTELKEKVGRTTSEIQLELNQQLKSLEEIVKQLYKSMNKKGPLTIVASFKPKPNGELECDFDTSEDNSMPEITSSSTKIVPVSRVSDSTFSSPPIDEDQTGEKQRISIKLDATTGNANQEECIELEQKRSIKISEDGQTLSYRPLLPSQVKAISSQMFANRGNYSSTLLKKPSVSFLASMVALGPVTPLTPPCTPPNNTGSLFDLGNSNNGINGNSFPLQPILKQSSSGLANGNNKTPTRIPLPESYYSSSGGEELYRPSTTTATYNSSSERSELRTAPPTIPSRTAFTFKVPASINPKLHHPSQTSLAQQQNQNNSGNLNNNWTYPPSYMNNYYQNMRLVKPCGGHEKSKIPVHNITQHQFEQGEGDYTEDSASQSDCSTDFTEESEFEDSVSVGTQRASSSSEETATEAESTSDENKTVKVPAKVNEIDLKPAISSTPSSKSGQQQKFRATVHIPHNPKKNSTGSYSQMFREKNNQQRTILADKTSRVSRPSRK